MGLKKEKSYPGTGMSHGGDVWPLDTPGCGRFPQSYAAAYHDDEAPPPPKEPLSPDQEELSELLELLELLELSEYDEPPYELELSLL
jgi:hypothetical protein